MKNSNLIRTAGLAVAVGFVLASSGSVLAQHGSDDQTEAATQTQQPAAAQTNTETKHGGSGGGGTSSGSSGSSGGSGRQQEAAQATRNEAEKEHSVETENHTSKADDESHNELHDKGAALVAELRKDHKTQTAEERQKKCETRKQGLENKFTRIVTNSQRVQSRFDGILDKAVAYQQANNLQPADFANLVAAAQTAKASSAASISALQSVKPTVDCNNASVAEDIATFKTAAQQARDNLKAYRAAVKAVLQALVAVQTPANTTGGSQ